MDDRLLDRLIKIVAFRNTLVHQTTQMDIRIVETVMISDLDELLAFAERIRHYVEGA
jgi:uncharacterized protein YutE (UPF0331/DUF86 family)